MKHSKRAYLAMLAAVAGLSCFSTGAFAQMRIDTSGHALDANTQVGSGGYNVTNNTYNQGNWNQYQNAITTNSTAGGFGFRGRSFNGVNLGVGYTDPFAFRGLLAGEGVDQFVSISTGVPTMENPTASSSNYAAPPNPSLTYYGSSNHVTVPPGTGAVSNNLGYMPVQGTSQSPQDSRIGTIDYSGNSQIIPKPYEMILPGPVDTSANPETQAQQMLAVNPLFGVVNWTMTPSMTQGNGSSIFGQSPLQQGVTPQVSQGLTRSQISDIRQEIASQSPNGIGNPTNLNQTSRALSPLRPGGENSTLGQPLSPLLSQNSQLKSENLSPLAGDVSTDQSSRQQINIQMPLPAAGQQSKQYAQLQAVLQNYNSGHAMTDQEANEKFQEILRLRNQANLNAESGGDVLTTPQGGALPDATGIPNPEQPEQLPTPDLSARPSRSATLKPSFNTQPQIAAPPAQAAPRAIDSFASGIASHGLANIVAGAEVAVQKKQYDKGIALYNQAIDVVPNNPLILVARATAELGGGYYAQANTDLHVAIAEDPSVLIGQYDLQKHLGEDRVNEIVKDLKSIATHQQDDTMHAFLLTYVYYNSRHIGQAADWLENTDKRAKGQDPALVQMKKYWNFTDEAPVPAAPSAPVAKPRSARPSTRPAR